MIVGRRVYVPKHLGQNKKNYMALYGLNFGLALCVKLKEIKGMPYNGQHIYNPTLCIFPKPIIYLNCQNDDL